MPERIQQRRTRVTLHDARGYAYEVVACPCGRPGSKGQHGYCSPECRFWSLVEKGDGCWLWIGARHNKKGYGRIDVRGKRWLAHRFAYTVTVGPIADGLELDHLCRNTRCVNPSHLDPVTSEVHDRERTDQGSHNRAKTHCKHGHEYTPENTRMSGTSRHCRACERKDGAGNRVMSRALSGRTWSHV